MSHDSDTKKVTRILKEILRSQPNILADPKPMVFLRQIDDSSINYSCFAFLDGLSDRLSTSHTLYEMILERFREEGIEIPYPQRDINIRQDNPAEDRPG